MTRKNSAAILCFMGIVVGMIAAAEIFGQREIIFPEMAALGMGCFLAPKLPWRTDLRRMVLCIELCALLGVGIVLWVPLPLWGQAALAYVVGQLVFLYSGTSLAPMLSAIVLPVLLQTRGIVYPIAALLLTLLLCALRWLLERRGVKEQEDFIPMPKPDRAAWTAFLFRSIFVAVFAFLCVRGHARFCMAPPLLVAFTELCRPECPAGKRRVSVFLLIGLCAVIGVAVRGVLVLGWELPLTAAAVVIAVAIVVLVKGFHLYFPPAGAMAILALLIPVEAMSSYAAQVCMGTAILLAVSALWVRWQQGIRNR